MTHRIIHLIDQCSLVLALEMCIGCILSYELGIQIAELTNLKSALISALWCTISAIIVMQATWQKSFEAGISRIIGSGLGTAVAAIIFYTFGAHNGTFMACIFLLVIFCGAINQEQFLRLALLTMTIIYVVCTISQPDDILNICLSRFIESLLGISVTLCVRFTTKPIHRIIHDAIALDQEISNSLKKQSRSHQKKK